MGCSPGSDANRTLGTGRRKRRPWGDGAKAIKAARAFLDAREADGKPWTSKESPGGAGIHQKQRGIAPASPGVETGGLPG